MSNVIDIDVTMNKLNIIKSKYDGTDGNLKMYRLVRLLDEEDLTIIAQETILNIHKISKAEGFIEGVVTSVMVMGALLWLKSK